MTIRTRSFRAYLSAAGHRNLDDRFRQLTWLWNRALCKRRQAWDRDETSVSLYDQCKELTITREDPEWSRFAVGMQRSTLKRLDDAFGALYPRSIRRRAARPAAGGQRSPSASQCGPSGAAGAGSFWTAT